MKPPRGQAPTVPAAKPNRRPAALWGCRARGRSLGLGLSSGDGSEGCLATCKLSPPAKLLHAKKRSVPNVLSLLVAAERKAINPGKAPIPQPGLCGAAVLFRTSAFQTRTILSKQVRHATFHLFLQTDAARTKEPMGAACCSLGGFPMFEHSAGRFAYITCIIFRPAPKSAHLVNLSTWVVSNQSTTTALGVVRPNWPQLHHLQQWSGTTKLDTTYNRLNV